ncbi:MAG: M20/M25/M40 family metallo-hydrolase [Clostridia bacterium]|nr:M20/M25/M40 family metallo-hydrolase [Clostridia bacterium]
MDFFGFLEHITTVPGTSGYEAQAAGAFARVFRPYCDEVHIDAMNSVVAVKRGRGGPRVMLCAHIDEVGLMTTGVEEDGSVRFLSMGAAAQILPAQEVSILTKEGPLYGVVGAAAPHLTDARERGKVTPADELYIDTGLAPEEVRRLVPAGTPVQFTGRMTALENGYVASKTLDDRACAAILFACAQELKSCLHDAEVIFVLSAREEIDSLGAMTSAEALRPDLAIILDVTHGTMEGCAPGETVPLDTTAISCGPNTHPKLADFITAHAKELGMKTAIEVSPGNTYTDAWEVQVACEGIPCAVISLPIKYMHTTVETGSLELMRRQAHLLARTVCDMHRGWEETLCY